MFNAVFKVFIDDYSDFTVLTGSKKIEKNLTCDKEQTSKLLQKHLQCYFGDTACVKNYQYSRYVVYDYEIPSYVHIIQYDIDVPSFVHKDTLEKVLHMFDLDSEIRLELIRLE